MSGSGLPAPAPHVTSETERFWSAAAEGTLLLRRCDRCGTVIWYPRAFCPACHSTDTSWFEASGRGSVHSFTVVRALGVHFLHLPDRPVALPDAARGAWADALPYVVAYVELDEGPRVLTNIVGCDVDAVHCGLPVEVLFDPTESGTAIFRFRPAPDAPATGPPVGRARPRFRKDRGAGSAGRRGR